MERAIANSSTAGDFFLDPFLGSGSTLIACERTGRRCAGIEIDPTYADVVLGRWERFSGQIEVARANLSLASVNRSLAICA